MLNIIENDVFNISNRVKNINKNYLIFYNTKKRRFEIHYKKGLVTCLEVVVRYPTLDYRVIVDLQKNRSFRIEKIMQEIEMHNKKIQESENENIKNDLISKVKVMMLKGV